MRYLYHFFIHMLILGMRIGSIWSSKLKLGLVGRRENISTLKTKLSPKEEVIWMHAASLGEYEQGLPVLQNLKKQFPRYKILITFFSPSGYQNIIRKNHIADVICYLPFDKEKYILEFLDHLQPKMFILVKYDYWYQLLRILNQKKVPVFVVSALFYPNQIFFKSYGKWFRDNLRKYVNHFFHQNQHSYNLANNIGLQNSSVSGDTRFDRVKQIRNTIFNIPILEKWASQKTTMVIGSAWESEEKIAELFYQNEIELQIIIAPHDLNHLQYLQKQLPDAVLFSEILTEETKIIKNIVLIDSIGYLSRIYRVGDFAIVGGGFRGSGLHNILEAATYGIPVLFGNHYKKNPEADALIDFGAAKSFENIEDMYHFIVENSKENNLLLKKMGEKSLQFIEEQPNATETIVKKILLEIST